MKFFKAFFVAAFAFTMMFAFSATADHEGYGGVPAFELADFDVVLPAPDPVAFTALDHRPSDAFVDMTSPAQTAYISHARLFFEVGWQA